VVPYGYAAHSETGENKKVETYGQNHSLGLETGENDQLFLQGLLTQQGI